MRIPLAALLLPLVLACASARDGGLAAGIEAAHGGDIYAMEPLHARVSVEFQGASMLDADMVYDAAGGRVRLEDERGRVAVFDGREAWASGYSDEELAMARFHLLTWPYFVAAPWKLDDPGAELDDARTRDLRGEPQTSARLSFGPGVGDTPDDWYVVYADPDDLRLTALAYVVTYGTTLAQAEEEPHVAVYEELETVDGLRVPARLRFWNWSESEGLVGQPIGSATIREASFAPAAPDAFEPPPGARRVDVPR